MQTIYLQLHKSKILECFLLIICDIISLSTTKTV